MILMAIDHGIINGTFALVIYKNYCKLLVVLFFVLHSSVCKSAHLVYFMPVLSNIENLNRIFTVRC